MKRIALLCIVSLSGLAMEAQNRADILVSYDVNSINWEKDTLQTIRMSLLANAKEAKYFNDLSLWTDSLKSTPEGKKQLQQIIMAACMTQSPEGA